MFPEGRMLGRMVILLGAVIVVLGALLTFSDKIPFLGRLPGDIQIHRKNVSFHFPVVTSLIVSIVLTVLLNLFSRK